jgi:enamine deaminase RidA (YjgF/YER057c/UK114 family)
VNRTLIGPTSVLAGFPAEATRYGPFLHISGQVALNPDTGRMVTGADDLSASAREQITAHHFVDDLEWPITAQTWQIYENMRRLLEPHGATLDNLVRPNTFFRDLDEFPGMERARAVWLVEHPPASTVLEMTDRGLHPEVRLMIDALAIVPDADLPDVRKAPVRSSIAPPAHYSVALQAGQLVWPAGQTAYNPKTREAVYQIEDLPAEAGFLATGNKHLDRREGPALAQTWAIYNNLKTILEEAGSSLEQILKETIWIRHLHHFPCVVRVRRHFFPDPSKAAACTVLQTVDLGRTTETLLEIDVVALAPGAGSWRKEVIMEAGGLTSPIHGPLAVKAGPLLFISGRTGVSGSPIQAGRPYAVSPAAQQAWSAFQELKIVLESQGATADDLLKLHLYTRDYQDLAEVERAAASQLGELPASLTLAMPAVDRDERVAVKVDAIARMPGKE